MRTRIRFSFALVLCFVFSGNTILADIVKTIGTTGADYTTLKSAFDDINNNAGGQYTGVIQLQVIDNTTETTTAVLNASANWTTVKIYPTVTGKSIAGDLNTPLITYNGASNVTIDGRLYNSDGVLVGNTKDLTISNANTGTGASTIYLTANASTNTITYNTIKGASTGSNGTIMMTVPTATDGMANNIISYNLITGISASVRPQYSVYAKGTGSYLNKGNKIQNNEFKDFFNLANTSSAIYIDGLSDTWTILNNSFYETSAIFAPTANVAYSVIQIAGGRTHSITRNYIGGSGATATGTWNKNSSTNNNFTAILIAAGTGYTSSVTFNVIKNITWTNGTAATSWKGIDVSGGGGNITVSNNSIGAVSGTESIFITNVTLGSNVYVIHIQNTGNATCENNIIGAIKADNATANNTNLYAIMKSATAGTVSISSNIINNLTANSASTGNAQNLVGVFNNGGTGTITINSNTIYNLINNNTCATTTIKGYTVGISSSNGANTINSNIIHDLTSANANADAANQASVVGIATSTSTVRTISGNTIYNLSNSRSDFTGYVLGIYFVGATNSVLNANFIHSLTVHSSTTSAKLGGIRIGGTSAGTFTNNIISLAGNTASAITGIAEATALASGYNTNYYHNTIYISGTPTTSTNNTIAYYSASTANQRIFKNNIFVNERSGTGTHYSFQTVGTGLTSDYNLYYVSGTGGVLANIGGDKANLIDLQAGTGGDQNSNVLDHSPFSSPNAIAESYMPIVEFNGVRLNNASIPVATDFMGYTRPDVPQKGALEIPVTWNGTSWSGGNTAAKTAIINGTYNDVGFSCLDLIVNAGKQISITSGTLSVAGNLTLKSDDTNGTATLIDNNGSSLAGTLTVTGTTTVQQYLAGSRNWYVSSPVSGATVATINTVTKSSIVSYDEVHGTSAPWVTESATLIPGKGYIVTSPLNSNATITFSGTLNSGNKSIVLTRTTGQTKEGFNLVGNPYPCFMNVRTAINSNPNLDKTIWYRTKNIGNTAYFFDTYNTTSAVGTNNNGYREVTGTIPPMQAIWMRVSTGQTEATLNFDNSLRSHKSDTINPLKVRARESVIQPLLRLQVSNGTNNDETIVYFNSSASDGFDEYDSLKMTNSNAAIPEIYTVEGNEKLVINGMNSLISNKELSLGFTTGNSNNFTLKAKEVQNFTADTKIILKDNLLNTEQDITDGTTYSFSSDVVDNSSRFSILFKSTSLISEIVPTANTQRISVFKDANNRIVVNHNATDGIEGQVTVSNAMGQQMFSMSTTGSHTVIDKVFSPGVNIVMINISGNKTTKKIIVNY